MSEERQGILPDRRALSEERIREVVKEAIDRDHIDRLVREAVIDAIKGANLIDGPTHVAHHQAINEFLVLCRHAKKTAVGTIIMGFVALLLLGLAAWRQ